MNVTLKNLQIFTILCVAMTLLCSCGGSYYERSQDELSKNRPYNCDGLHVKMGVWHYVDSFGQVVDTKGRCYKGMKHGNFDFFVNGIKVATTKYERDAEVYTSCYVKGLQTLDLQTCMRVSASNVKNMNNVSSENNKTSTNSNAPIIMQEPVKKSVWD